MGANFLGLSTVCALMELCCAILCLWLVVGVPVPHLFQQITRAWLWGPSMAWEARFKGPQDPQLGSIFSHTPLQALQ